jgi:hypothetical protein
MYIGILWILFSISCSLYRADVVSLLQHLYSIKDLIKSFCKLYFLFNVQYWRQFVWISARICSILCFEVTNKCSITNTQQMSRMWVNTEKKNCEQRIFNFFFSLYNRLILWMFVYRYISLYSCFYIHQWSLIK